MQRAAREDVCISSTGLGLMVITDLAFLLPAALKSNVIKHGVVGAGVSLLSLPGMPWWGWLFCRPACLLGVRHGQGSSEMPLRAAGCTHAAQKPFLKKPDPFCILTPPSHT